MNTQTIYLNHSWKFHYGEEPDAWKKDYDDTDWTAVELPHDWSVTMPFSRSYSSGTGYAAGGIGWYRGTFSLQRAVSSTGLSPSISVCTR